jgi:hypothetical protein
VRREAWGLWWRAEGGRAGADEVNGSFLGCGFSLKCWRGWSILCNRPANRILWSLRLAGHDWGMTEDDVQLVRGSGVSRVRRREGWGRIVRAWQESGVSAVSFAQQHGLRVKALFRWQHKLRAESSAAAVFDEIQSPATPEAHALELRTDVLRVLVHNHCDADLLRSVVQILREGSC